MDAPNTTAEFGTGLLEEEPSPIEEVVGESAAERDTEPDEERPVAEPEPAQLGTFGALLQEAMDTGTVESTDSGSTTSTGKKDAKRTSEDEAENELYVPHQARVTPAIDDLLCLRSVNPLYGRVSDTTLRAGR